MEWNKLQPSERLDELLCNDLRIIQSDEVFAFSMDAVLLARFCSAPARGRIMDLCTGNGVIPLLLSTRTQAAIHGVEIQPRLADMAVRSIAINELQKQITIYNADIKSIHEEVGYEQYDLVTVNPPYMPVRAGEQNNNEHFAAARHEIHCTLDDVTAACNRLVRFGGKVAMVHRPTRLVDILASFRRYRLEPKRIRFVHPKASEEANMVLIEAIRDGKPDVRLLPPLIVYNEQHQYTTELLDIYYGGQDNDRSSSEELLRG